MKHSTFALAERTKEIQIQIKEDGMRDKFDWLVDLKIKRPGIKDLMKYLATTDFYTAPCSRFHHLNVSGGLVTHSLNVYEALERVALNHDLRVKKESWALVSLFHDLCKVNFYIRGTRNIKDERTGVWKKEVIWKIEDQFPMGHGEKSLAILQRFLPLLEAEALAVRHHMANYDLNANSYALSEATRKVPLVGALILADQEATFFMDGKVKEKEKQP